MFSYMYNCNIYYFQLILLLRFKLSELQIQAKKIFQRITIWTAAWKAAEPFKFVWVKQKVMKKIIHARLNYWT